MPGPALPLRSAGERRTRGRTDSCVRQEQQSAAFPAKPSRAAQTGAPKQPNPGDRGGGKKSGRRPMGSGGRRGSAAGGRHLRARGAGQPSVRWGVVPCEAVCLGSASSRCSDGAEALCLCHAVRTMPGEAGPRHHPAMSLPFCHCSR